MTELKAGNLPRCMISDVMCEDVVFIACVYEDSGGSETGQNKRTLKFGWWRCADCEVAHKDGTMALKDSTDSIQVYQGWHESKEGWHESTQRWNDSTQGYYG
jgi:hypothetical protein